MRVGVNARSVYWHRFHIHAELVRSLTLTFSARDNISSALLGLGALGVQPIIPNLDHLETIVQDISSIDSRSLLPLMTCTIHDFSLIFVTDPRRDPADLVISTFVDLLRMAHQLTLDKLSLSSAHSSLITLPRAVAEISMLIAQQRGLKHLEMDDFQSRFHAPFSAAAGLSDLLTTSFAVNNTSADIVPLYATPLPIDTVANGFPSLREMDAQLAGEDIPRLLTAVASPKVKKLLLYTEPSTMELEGPVSLSGIDRFKQLSSITVNFVTGFGEWKGFVPLLDCPKLHDVRLVGDEASRIFGDREIRSMSRAWPFLQSLWIEDCCRRDLHGLALGHAQTYTPHTTLIGLSALATNCLKLQSLVLSIDARQTPSDPIITAVGASVKDLRFPCSPVDGREEETAQFIASMWPHHKYPCTTPAAGQRQEWCPDFDRGARWDRIWSLARDVARAQSAELV